MSSLHRINSESLVATTASVTFSDIPQTYQDLFLVCTARFGSASGARIRFNSDSGTNYSLLYMISSSQSGSIQNGIITGATGIHNNLVYGDATVTNEYTPYLINIISYRNTSNFKTVLWQYGTDSSLQGSSSEVGYVTGTWRNTAAINSIQLLPHNATNFEAGSTFTLWGVV